MLSERWIALPAPCGSTATLPARMASIAVTSFGSTEGCAKGTLCAPRRSCRCGVRTARRFAEAT
jgi:hypothetical protein